MIPKVIHYCWFGGNPKNPLIDRCIASWKKYCPDYQIIEWNESNYDVTKNAFIKKAYETNNWAFISDYARVDILYQYGGVYMDTDVELIASLDPFLEYDFYAGFESAAYVAFGLGFGSVAGHPVLKDIKDTYDQMELPEHLFDLPTCPQIQTAALKKRGLICNNENQVLDGCHIFSSEYFCPMSYVSGITTLTDNTVSIHHYDMSWFSESYRRAKHRQWKLVQKFGPKIGRKLNSIISFPDKLISYTKSGALKDYLKFLMHNKSRY